MEKIIRERIADHLATVKAVQESELPQKLSLLAAEVKRALAAGGKVMFCGNGGSAADSQHLAAEFVGRFQKERKGLPAIALTVDTSILTAVGNDYGYARVFARQVEALGQKGDVLVAISTSGNSQNVLEAVALAKQRGIFTAGFTALGGGKMAQACDLCLAVPDKVTARAQEIHILLGHILCELVDEE